MTRVEAIALGRLEHVRRAREREAAILTADELQDVEALALEKLAKGYLPGRARYEARVRVLELRAREEREAPPCVRVTAATRAEDPSVVARLVIDAVLEGLSVNARRVLWGHADGETFEEIGGYLHLTGSRIQQIHAGAMEKIREAVYRP